MRQNEIRIEKIGNIYGFSGGNFGGNIYSANALSPTIHRPTGGQTQPIFMDQQKRVKRHNKRFRRLTPLEAWRLMAFDDIDFYRAKYGREFPYELKVKQLQRSCTRKEWKRLYRFLRHPIMSDTQLYQQAGNSICVNALVAIFGQMYAGHERDYEKLYLERYEA